MSHELICAWLKLPPDSWPPDHYLLLGLPRGESDVRRIEEEVHQRLCCLRQYQLNHPDQATEAMNRLAQAFSCLTDPQAKKAYDAALTSPTGATLLAGQASSATDVAEPIEPAVAASDADPLAWLFGPWSRLSELPLPPAAPPAEEPPATPTAVTAQDWTKSPPPPRAAASPNVETAIPVLPANGAPAPAATVATPVAEPVDPVLETARSSKVARCGLGTRRALCQRIADTRELLWAWEQAGKYLGKPQRRLTRLVEATDLIQQLTEIRELLQDFPPLLGEAGQPGYLVTALARQQMIVPTFRSLLPSQREALARDWHSGHSLLKLHRRFLRDELRCLRRKNIWGHWTHALRAFLTDQPGTLLLFLALLALNLALWKYIWK